MNNDSNKGFLDRIPTFSLMLIMVIFTLIGMALVNQIKVTQEPEQQQGSRLNISFRWSGASPRVIEQEVTSRLEAMLSSVSGVERLSSTSRSGSGSVNIYLKDGVDVSSVRFEISSLIRQVAKNLPEDVSYPYLSGGTVRSGVVASKQLLTYRLNADMDKADIQEFGQENIQPYLEMIDGVTEVTINGYMPQMLEIIYNPIQLENYGVSVNSISTAINNLQEKSVVVGDIERVDEDGVETRTTLHLQVSKTSPDLSSLPIATVDGKSIELGSIAKLTYKDKPSTGFYRINGLNTVYLNIKIDESAPLIAMSEIVRGEVDQIREKLEGQCEIHLLRDEAKEIKEEIETLVRRTFLSLLILMVFVWLVSRSMRYLSIIAISLTSNIFIAVILYYLFDVQLHVFSLAGIAVSFGIIIDTTIVMVDHYSYYHNRKAFLAILAALLTTISSLIVVYFMPDFILEELGDFSAIIIINLSVALVVALFFVPAIVQQFKYSSQEDTKSIKVRRKVVGFSSLYRRYIVWSQRHKWWLIAFFILAFGIPVHLLPTKIGEPPKQKSKRDPNKSYEMLWYHDAYNSTIGSDFYQNKLKEPLSLVLGGSLRLFTENMGSAYNARAKQEKVLHVKCKMPMGGTVDELNKQVLAVESIVSQYDDEINRYVSSVYSDGWVSIYFEEEYRDTSFPVDLENEIIEASMAIGGVEWNTYGVSRQGYSSSINFAQTTNKIRLTGYNLEQLFRISDELIDLMKANNRATDIQLEMQGYSGGKPTEEMYIDYDMEKVALYDYNLSSGYNSLKSLLNSGSGGRIYGDNFRIDVTVESSERDNFDVWHLLNSYVPVGNSGKMIKYSLISEIGKRKSQSVISKRNQEYTLEIGFNFLGSAELTNRFVEYVTDEMNSRLPVGYNSQNGSDWWFDDTGEQYWMLLLIVVIIFFVCSILFESLIQPLVIISLVPISFIGIFLTFAFWGGDFEGGGFASLVLLSGLVVNAAIYIINEYNHSRENFADYSLNSVRLYVKSFNHKIIPVFLTIISTVLGLIPFLMDGPEEKFWFTFALGTSGGLIFSILAIIFMMPVLMPFKTDANAEYAARKAAKQLQ
ncbi:MAG: efflux RND transporter permease subunit [Rikenellaceae bacterium]